MGEVLVLYALKRAFALYRVNPTRANRDLTERAAMVIASSELEKAGAVFKGSYEGPRREHV